MTENYFQYNQAYCFLRHSLLEPNRITLLFLHGIGDSSLSFLPFLQSQLLEQFNILIPDFLGYGKSSENIDYSFEVQTQAVISHIIALEKQIGFSFDDIILIPHPMAGIHAMLFSESLIKEKIRGIINIEGSITQYGSFISQKVSRIHKQGIFDSWFHQFKEEIIFNEFIKKFPVCRSYYASLRFCHLDAFLQNALEMRKICLADQEQYTNNAGNKFASLKIPKIYCYGDKSLCQESIDFLNEKRVPTKIFDSENHFVMLDCFDEFVQFIDNWINMLPRA